MSEDPAADKAELLKWLSVIETLPKRLATVRQPRLDSKAVALSHQPFGDDLFSLSLGTLAVGFDHLESWRRLRLDANLQPNFAHFTLLRAAGESAVFVRWLCEPDISDSVRLSRSAGATWVDLEERRKIEADMQIPREGTGQWKPANERQADLLAKAAGTGIQMIRPPDRTRLFRLYAPPSNAAVTKKNPAYGQALYRVLTGPSHSQQWSWLPHTEHEVVGGSLGTTKLAYLTPSIATAALTTAITVMLYRRALTELERFAGHA